MAIPIRYIYNSKGYAEVWLFPADAPGCRLFALEPSADCSLIKSWAACSETVEEFLDSMALEGLLTLTQLETLVQTLSPLRRIWKQLRILCQQVGDIGVYPGHIVVEEGEYFQENEQINLTQHQIREAEQVWSDYEEGNRAALHSLTFGSVLQEIGFLAGRRLGLVFTSATHFSDWLASRITGWEISHGNEEVVEVLHRLASQVVHRDVRCLSFAYRTPTWWEDYQVAIPAIVEMLKRGRVRSRCRR